VARVGILGGTFNPPHLGHLALARHARDELALERVLLMPVNVAPQKQEQDDPGARHRLRMCRLSAHGVAAVSACALEIERGGRSYTVDTLRALHAAHPAARLTLIVGGDTACTLASWREPQAVLELAELAVGVRAGATREQVLEAVGTRNRAERVRFLEMPTIDISSSAVRRRVAQGGRIEGLVAVAVARYIAEHGLYRATARMAP
jgi:nicotinate-nucleotide adenylyltransferase